MTRLSLIRAERSPFPVSALARFGGSTMRLFLTISTIVLTVAARPAPSLALAVQQQQSQDTVAGVVLDSIGGRPLVAAQVVAQGTQRRDLTDERGRFRLTGLSGQTVTIRVTK